MNNQVLLGRTKGDLTSGNACWETPPLVFQGLQRDFGPFDIDLTADVQRHLLPFWFGPGSDIGTDALVADWSTGPARSGFSNPPYGPFVQGMLAKAKFEARRGFHSLLLLPMRVTRAFRAHVLDGASDLIFCDSRLVFFDNGVPRINDKTWRKTGRAVAEGAPFDSILVRFSPDGRGFPRLGTWHVPPHVTPADLARALLLKGLRGSTDQEAAAASPDAALSLHPEGGGQ